MKVAINIDVEPGAVGGVAPALHSLLSALGRLTDGPERYVLAVRSQAQADWLSGLGANQEIVFLPSAAPKTLREKLWHAREWVRRELTPAPSRWPELPLSYGFYEGLKCDVVHFPTQSYTYCAVPTVYNPHDLQHLHYPQFFTIDRLAWREVVYRSACRLSQAIIVNSQWTKDDIVRQFAVDPGKVQVIPEAAPTDFMPSVSEADKAAVLARYGIAEGFAFYPSMTWPHKNHVRLFEALADLRDRRGLTVRLVCTGARHEESWDDLQATLKALRLEDQVRFLGFVTPSELRCLYRLARCLVLPSLFEANSLPIFEAWAEGAPVASSNITALPEQVGDAGLLFDPLDSGAMAQALERIFTDDALCADLRAKGRVRLADFDWDRTARAYRAIYRRAAGRALSAEDRELLAWDWMANPRRERGAA